MDNDHSESRDIAYEGSKESNSRGSSSNNGINGHMENEDMREFEDKCELLEEEEREIEQIDEDEEQEMLSISSGDLAVADEACDISDEEDPVEVDVEQSFVFDPNTFVPSALEHIRPPWIRVCPPPCESRHWEIFRDALETFDASTVLDGIDDFIVTIETLLPHLPSCLIRIRDDEAQISLDVSTRILGWLRVCLQSEPRGLDEFSVLYDLAFSLIKIITESDVVMVGKKMLENNLLMDLLDVIENSTFTSIRSAALLSVFRFVVSPWLWRFTNEELRRWDDGGESIYSRLVAAVCDAEHHLETTGFVRLATLTLTWSRFTYCLNEFDSSVKQFLTSVTVPNWNRTTVDLVCSTWKELMTSFEGTKKCIADFGDEKICAAFDIYALLESSSVLYYSITLLDISRWISYLPCTLPFLRSVLNDKYYGLLYISNSSCVQYLLETLLQFSANKKVNSANFDEGFCTDDFFTIVERLRLMLANRLYVLKLIDRLKACSNTLRTSIDNEERVAILTSLSQLCIDFHGRQSVAWLLAQKYIYYLFDILEFSQIDNDSSDARYPVSFLLAMNLLSIVIEQVDEPRFWLRHIKTLSKLIRRRIIPLRPQLELSEYVEPLSDTLVQSLGSGTTSLIGSLLKKMDSCRVGERKMQVPFATITCVRLLEAMLCDVNNVTRLDIIKTMVHDEVAETLTKLLHDFVLFRHAMWQMGEPLVSSDVRRFLRFTLPALRIIATIYRQGSECIGRKLKMSKSIRVRMLENQRTELNDGHMKLVDTEVKSCYIDTTLVDTLLLLWSITGGMNGQGISEEGTRLRQLVFEVIHPVIYGPGKSALPVILDRIFDRCCQRPQLYPTVLSFIFAIAPSSSVIVSDKMLWKSELIKNRRNVKIFASSFLKCETRTELCDVLLCTSSYVSQISRAFLGKLCKLHSVLAKDIIGSLIYRVSESLVSHTHNPISKELVEAISDDDEEKERKKEKSSSPTLICCEGAERASSGHVRLIESLLDLCQIDIARVIIPYYLIHDKSALEVISRYLFVFEKAVADSERQKRFQQAVVEFFGPVCQGKYWEIQKPTGTREQEQVIQHEITAQDLKEVELKDNSNCITSQKLDESKEQRSENHRDGCSEDQLKYTVTSSNEQSNEQSKSTYVASHPLEAILLSFCRFISNCEHGLKLIRAVLSVLNEIADSESASSAMLRVCLLRIGMRRLLVRLDSSFGSDGVIETLFLVANLLEKLFCGQAQELSIIVGYVPSGHTLLSLVELLKGQPEISEISKSCLESLLRLGTTLLEVESQNERLHFSTPVVVFRKNILSDIFGKKFVQLVEGEWTATELRRKSSSIPVQLHQSSGVRMGGEVARTIDQYTDNGLSVHRLMEKAKADSSLVSGLHMQQMVSRKRQSSRLSSQAPEKVRRI